MSYYDPDDIAALTEQLHQRDEQIAKLESDLKDAEELLRDYGTDLDGYLFRAVNDWLDRRKPTP